MRRYRVLLALLIIACSEPETTETAVAVVEPEPGDDEGEAPAEAEAPSSDERAPSPVELPVELLVPDQLAVREREGEIARWGVMGTWPEIAHPDGDVRAVLASTLEGVVREVGHAAGSVSCHAHLAHESLVSVTCAGIYEIRAGIGWTVVDIHLAIAAGEARPFALEDAFVPGTNPYELGGDDPCPEGEDEWGSSSCDYTQVGFGPRGLVFVFHNYGSTEERRAFVPYTDIREHIRADGPLAPVLGGGEARFDEVAESDATGWAVTEFGSEPALVRRWMDAPDLTSGSLLVDHFGGGLARLVTPGRDGDVARLAARALGGEATPISLSDVSGRVPLFSLVMYEGLTTEAREALTLRWVRTTEDLNLRPRGGSGPPSARRVLAVIPAGSFVAAVGGELRQRGQYEDVVTAFGPGALASLHLRAHEGCVIPPGETSRHVAKVRVRHNGSARDAWLVVSRRERGSRVALHETGESECTLGEEILGANTERSAFDVRLTGTTEHGGSTLLVVGTGLGRRSPGEMRYRVWRVGSRRSLLDETFTLDRDRTELGVRLGETEGTYFPVTLESRGTVRRFSWIDGQLVERSPPE